MRLVVLGSGTGVPSASRISSGYWLEAGSARLRLDCGPGTTHAMARLQLPWAALTHQWVSHFHIDHALEIPALLFAFKYGRGARPAPRDPLQLIGPGGLRRLVDGLLAAFDSDVMEQELEVRVTELDPGAILDLGGGAVARVAKTPHTDESLALRVEAHGRAVGYTGDTAPSDELAAFFRDVDVLVAEASFVDDARGTRHMCVDDTARLAAAARARHLVAVHAYFDPDAEPLAARLARTFTGRTTVATDGLTLDF
jgi:ribonuclease BN (tRNA processing enzyme)